LPSKYLTVKPAELLHPFTASASEWVPALTNLRSNVALFPRLVVVLRVWPAHAMRLSEEERARLKALVEGHDWAHIGHKTAESASARSERDAD
jgi:hypothetical protein